MKHRRLGNSGLKVSEISYGGWISRTEGEAVEVAVAALEAGVTTFDTADVYGGTRAETVLGAVLRQVPRESVEISTKVFGRVGPGANQRGLSRKHIMEAAHASLRRLQVDHIDLYQLHRYDPDVPLRETLRAMDDLVRQGKVLYVGVSEWTPEQIREALRIADELGLDRIVSDQPQYNMLWRVVEEQVRPLCEREGFGLLAWSPLAQGLLTGKYRPGSPPPEGSRAVGPASAKFAMGGLDDDVLIRIDGLREIAAELGLSLTRLSLAWVLSQPSVSSVIVGASSPEQITHSAAAAGTRLDDDVLARIDEVVGPIVERDPSKIPSQPDDYRKDTEKETARTEAVVGRS